MRNHCPSTCNLHEVTPVKRPYFALRILLAVLFCAHSGGAGASSAGVDVPNALGAAREAARMMLQCNPRGAAVIVRHGLAAEPGNLLLRQQAAALLLMTGDAPAATIAWEQVLSEHPGDPLAIYGMGVLALHKGERSRARDLFRALSRSGDQAVRMIAERYLDSLDGASGAGLGLALPDSYAAPAKGLSGIAAARMGDARRALDESSEALAALPGDPYYETPGIVMTFDPAAPIRFGYSPLPTGNGLAPRKTGSGASSYSGTLRLAPDDTGAGTGFVVFKVDGGLAAMVNTRPFELAWDTTRVANGSHKVEIIVYDRHGGVIQKAERVVRTLNATVPVAVDQHEGPDAAVRTALWQALALQPSRHALAVTAAESAGKLGEHRSAIGFWKLAAGLDPGFRDTRARLASVLPYQALPTVWRANSDAPVVALTFDDGPRPGISEKLVDLLIREQVPATFFVIGRHAAAYPELIKQIATGGFQIENHSYTHPNLTMLSQKAVESELLRTLAAVYAVTGRTMRYYRPPGGNTNGVVAQAAARWGLTPCMWTLDADALENGNPDKLAEYVVQGATPGAIILLHNGRKTTLDALPRIIAGLRRRGFRFDTIDGLLSRAPMTAVRSAASGRR